MNQQSTTSIILTASNPLSRSRSSISSCQYPCLATSRRNPSSIQAECPEVTCALAAVILIPASRESSIRGIRLMETTLWTTHHSLVSGSEEANMDVEETEDFAIGWDELRNGGGQNGTLEWSWEKRVESQTFCYVPRQSWEDPWVTSKDESLTSRLVTNLELRRSVQFLNNDCEPNIEKRI